MQCRNNFAQKMNAQSEIAHTITKKSLKKQKKKAYFETIQNNIIKYIANLLQLANIY